ncbi:MAG: hypothetical protein FJ387_02120 [Verrucomicrobia bacterium]|nr:hypothetical protein [Verrucomicrobiota bacterium]
MKTLDAKAAASLEKTVRDALELAETQNGTTRPDCLSAGFFTRIARQFCSEPFGGPPQATISRLQPPFPRGNFSA